MKLIVLKCIVEMNNYSTNRNNNYLVSFFSEFVQFVSFIYIYFYHSNIFGKKIMLTSLFFTFFLGLDLGLFIPSSS